jgi:hypothetical protein
MMRYLPENYKRVKPLHILVGNYEPLRCKSCGKDLLEELYKKEYEAIIVVDRTYSGDYKTEHVYSFSWVCKGTCDRKISEQIRLVPGHTDGWEDISDLAIPLFFLRWLFAHLNTLREGRVIFEDDAFSDFKYFVGALAQRVFREMTELEKERVATLLRLPEWA